jgi:hypothetical protein
MRHADIKTTNDYYTDLRLHDLDGAVNQLSMPELVPKKQEQEYRATGTGDCSGNCPKTVHETVRAILRWVSQKLLQQLKQRDGTPHNSAHITTPP